MARPTPPGGSSAEARRSVEELLALQGKQIQAILANDSKLAIGAVEALRARKLDGKVFVAGADARLGALRNLAEDRQQLEILRVVEPMAQAAAEAAMKFAAGEPISTDGNVDGSGGFQIPIIKIPVFSIRNEDIEDKVIAAGLQTREAIYGAA